MSRLCPAILAAMAILILASLPGIAQDMDELEVDHALTFDFETPHTDWAQPYALGKTRVLFFTDGRGTNPRECVEVMQRFDIEAEAVFYARIVDSAKSHWHGDETGERRMINLLKEQWDCIVFMEMDMADMSPEMQYRVLKPVSDGAGIVFVGSNDERVLKDANVVLETPPFLAGEPVGDPYTTGNGRGMRLPAKPKLDFYPGWEVDYDYWSERLGRAILWAAGKESTLNLSIASTQPDYTWGSDLEFAIDASGECAGKNPMMKYRVRTNQGAPVVEETDWMPVKAKVTEVKLPGFKHVAGAYHLDVQVRSDKGIEAWATLSFELTSSRSVADLSLIEAWGEVEDNVAGSVSLDGAPVANETLTVSLLDPDRRVLAQKQLPAANDAVEFDFAIEPWMPMLVTVEARLDSDGAEVARAWKFFNVAKRNRGQFNFLIWDVPSGSLAPYAERSLAENSVTLQLRSGTPPAYVAANNISWVPYTTRILSRKTEDGIMQPFCWNDEQAVQTHVTNLAQKYMASRQHGVFVWSLGDEVHTLGACLSPHCEVAYREYLEEQYGTLAALNESWGTEFGTWNDVGLSNPDDSEEAASKRDGNFPRWFDRQAFKSYNFVQFCGKYAKAYRDIDPESLTGFEGAGRFERGDDLDLIIRSNEFWSPYPGTADEVIRSIAPRDFPRANWMGYTKDADSLLQKYWRMVTRGMDAVWFWRWDCIGRFHGWLAPDLRPFPAVKEILEDSQFMRDGLGDVLLKSEMLDDDVAILYSYPSTFAHKLEDGATYGGCESSHLAAHTLVRDLGLQFRYVTDRMLRLGEFDQSKYRVLFLPRTAAIGPQEAGVIREYVEQGGTVVADVRPGIYDGHCKPLERGILDDLFGVERTGREAAVVAKDDVYGALKMDPSVKVTDGEAMVEIDGLPAFISKQTGAGRAMLLNFDLSTYPKLNVSNTPEQIADQALGMFDSVGVSPTVRLTTPDGRRERNVETIRWQNGDIQIVSLFRSGGLTTDAVVKLPAPMYVYDMRNGESLGKVASFETRIIANRASFFALTTKPAPAAKLSLSAASAAPGSVVTSALSVPGAEGLHGFRLALRRGDENLDWLDDVLVAGAEAVEFDIPVALNDPAGDYSVEVTDVYTGLTTTAQLRVE